MLKFLRGILRSPAPPTTPTPDPLATIRAELENARRALGRIRVLNGAATATPAHMWRGQHYHVCIEPTCWSYLACDKPQNECPVGPWTCPCCEHAAMGTWLDAEERRQKQGGGNV
jgi:hypothetical protein